MDKAELLGRMTEDTKQYADRLMEIYEAPYARHMGIEIDSVAKDEVVCSMEVQPFMINSMGRIHGAVIYALMDHTFAAISNMTQDGTGQSMEVKYFRPANTKLRCVAKPLNVSRSLAVYEVKAYSEEGKLIASANCTAFILKKIE